MLWILASFAFALLCYEIPTLVSAVLWPLWNNPLVLQTDFHYYYEAALRFSSGGPLYLASDDVIAGFAYPPPAIVPFVVLAKLPLGAALLLFTLASYAALLIAIRLWFTYLRRNGMAVSTATEIAITVIVTALGPSYMNMMIGQVNAFVLFSSIVFVSFAPFLPPISALMLASGIWLKIYPAALGAVGAWDSRTWKALGWTVVAMIALAIAALPAVPLSAYQSFLTEVLPSRIDKTAIHITNQSLVAFVERFRYPSYEFLNWTGHEAVTVTTVVRIVNLLCAVAAVVLLWTRSRRRGGAVSAAGLLALVAVIAPLGWGHTYLMVMPLVALHLAGLKDARPVIKAVICVCVVALMLPAGRLLPIDAAPDWMENLVYSRYLLATLTLLMLDLDTGPRRA